MLLMRQMMLQTCLKCAHLRYDVSKIINRTTKIVHLKRALLLKTTYSFDICPKIFTLSEKGLIKMILIHSGAAVKLTMT